MSNLPSIFKPLRHLMDFGTGRGRSAVSVPEGRRYYVIGDIHGRSDLVGRLHRQILADSTAVRRNMQLIAVYLGDYVDRGPDSRGVIDLLLDNPLNGFAKVYLKGNHEDALLRFLDDPAEGRGWLGIGGLETLLSYGVHLPQNLSPHEELEHVWAELRLRMPSEHLAFLGELELRHEAGGYLFVHAGVRPGRPLSQQHPHDLMWIRDDFLRSRQNHGKIVVHGHSPGERPDVQDNRIGIDTTAYATDTLTCLVLERTTRRFLATRPGP
ncbi:MAG: metallophosphoesterase family protein [Kiloniellales bacterium]